MSESRETTLTLRGFLEEKSNAAWISFDFSIGDMEYCCIGVDDFVKCYGTFSEHVLDDYVVVGHRSTEPSQSQGSVYFLTLMPLQEYMREEAGKVTYTKGQAETIRKYVCATMDALVGEYPILDTGTGLDAMERVCELLRGLSYKDKCKIRSMVLGINYMRYEKRGE